MVVSGYSVSIHLYIMLLDINECVGGMSSCNQECVNAIGSYNCTCYDGFYLLNDNHTCQGNSILVNL